jgi:AcrR family transcriptional regulator
MTPSTTYKGELTRSNIIESAHELFITQGYHGTSMRQIARNAGIALGGIYNHFASKEEIFQAVFLENHAYLAMIPAIESAQGETIEEVVRNAAHQMMGAIYSRPDFLNLMFIEIVEFKSVHVHRLFKTTFSQGMKIVKQITGAEGKLRNIPAPMLMRVFISLFTSYYLIDIILGEAAPPEFKENAMTYYVDIFLHGILDDSG